MQSVTMHRKGIFWALMGLEAKYFFISAVVGFGIAIALYYLSATGGLPFQMPFSSVTQAVTRR